MGWYSDLKITSVKRSLITDRPDYPTAGCDKSALTRHISGF
ncbi:MAG: hypothetical protein U7127_25415 [Phormidium sp.]|uniref:Uncharacterized protein n=1 Tax=Floridaenema aerugineum BLCC-F46 TaxID=3153654 RepID=A0ABV4X7T3_9CYAN